MNFNLNININIMDVKRYKAGTLKGELTTAEIRKLIRAHNKASSIKIPPKSSREDIVGILQKAGYVVNHEKAELRPVSKGKVQKLKVISQQTIAEELPKPKTKEEKETARKLNLKKKQDKEAELIKKGATIQRLISKKQKAQEVEKPKPNVEKPKEEPKVETGGIPQLKKFDVIQYNTRNQKVTAYVSSTLAGNKFRMNHIILKKDGSFSEDEKDTIELPDLQLTKSRKFKFIGKLDRDKYKVIFQKK
jgi:hypothetical protein